MSDRFDRYAPSESHSSRIVLLLGGLFSLDMVLEGMSVLTAGMLHEGGLESALANVGMFVDVSGIVAGWAVLLAGIVGLAASLTVARGTTNRDRDGSDSTTAVGGDEHRDPLTVLQTRYADGELSDEEFECRLASLLESDEFRETSEDNRTEKLLE